MTTTISKENQVHATRQGKTHEPSTAPCEAITQWSWLRCTKAHLQINYRSVGLGRQQDFPRPAKGHGSIVRVDACEQGETLASATTK